MTGMGALSLRLMFLLTGLAAVAAASGNFPVRYGAEQLEISTSPTDGAVSGHLNLALSRLASACGRSSARYSPEGIATSCLPPLSRDESRLGWPGRSTGFSLQAAHSMSVRAPPQTELLQF